MQSERPRCRPIRPPIEAGGSGSDRTIETHDQKYDVQRCVPLSILNNRFLGVFRVQAPGITLQLPIDTRIDAASNQRPRNITHSTSISRVNFRIGAERQTRQLRLRIWTHYPYSLPNDQGFARYGLPIQYTEAHGIPVNAILESVGDRPSRSRPHSVRMGAKVGANKSFIDLKTPP